MEVVTVATSSIDLWHNAGIEATKTTTAIRNAIRFVNGHRRKKKKKKQATAANETKQNKYEAAPLLRYNATHATQIDENKSRNTK